MVGAWCLDSEESNDEEINETTLMDFSDAYME